MEQRHPITHFSLFTYYLMFIAQLQSLSKIYHKPGSPVEVRALHDVDLSFEAGDYVAIMGASGSGKSTLLNIMGCLDRPTSGRYLLGGEDVSKLDDNQLSTIRGRRLGFIFQGFNLVAQLTVLENLELPLSYQGVAVAERRERAQMLMEAVGLQDRSHHLPSELSGGQQQRVAIARSIINDPLLLLADEPTGNLDSKTGASILAIFEQFNLQGRTIVMVTHDAAISAACKRVISLADGKVVDDRR